MYSLIDGIRTGPGIQWPDGRRVAVMLTFDFEAETLRISNLARQGKEPDEQDQGRYGGSDFLSSSFFRSFSRFGSLRRTWSVLSFSVLTGTFGRLLVLFALLPAGTQKSFFCLSAWRSSIIPYAGSLCKPFLQVFCSFFAFGLFSQFFSPFYPVFCLLSFLL